MSKKKKKRAKKKEHEIELRPGIMLVTQEEFREMTACSSPSVSWCAPSTESTKYVNAEGTPLVKVLGPLAPIRVVTVGNYTSGQPDWKQ